jgi:hypothetical protein
MVDFRFIRTLRSVMPLLLTFSTYSNTCRKVLKVLLSFIFLLFVALINGVIHFMAVSTLHARRIWILLTRHIDVCLGGSNRGYFHSILLQHIVDISIFIDNALVDVFSNTVTNSSQRAIEGFQGPCKHKVHYSSPRVEH